MRLVTVKTIDEKVLTLFQPSSLEIVKLVLNPNNGFLLFHFGNVSGPNDVIKERAPIVIRLSSAVVDLV